METKYWFVLKPSVFVWKKGKECLFYDSSTFIGESVNPEDPETEKFIEQIIDFDNLYCIQFTFAGTDKDCLNALVDRLVYLKMARLVIQNEENRKPIQLPPLLNLQSQIQRLQSSNVTDRTVGEEVMNNLQSICFDFSESTNAPTTGKLLPFLKSLELSNIEITIRGYSPLLETDCIFWKQLQCMSHIRFIFDLDSSISEKIMGLNTYSFNSCKYDLIIRPENDIHLIEKIIDNVPKGVKLNYNFQVFTKEDLEFAEKWVNRLQISDYKITPCYNGNNLDFFADYVYIGKNDIMESCQTKQNIFAHQALNTNDFGKLTVNSEGKVYANIHHKPLGSIDDDIRYLVYKEMLEGTSWRRVRSLEPCSDCVYQWLCPSPSNYEIEIGKPNLCNIKP